VGHQKAFHTYRAFNWLTLMSEYTHNDDVADLIYAKEQEIKMLKEALQRIETELNRITNEYARGL
jgi:peptidoglycan hydrolase CwlO-like protein